MNEASIKELEQSSGLATTDIKSFENEIGSPADRISHL